MTSPAEQPLPESMSTAQLASYLVASFGERHPSGYVLVNKTVREIALATGRSPGTIQNHLRRMDELGIRVDPQRRLFDGSLARAPKSPASSGSPPIGRLETGAAVSGTAVTDGVVSDDGGAALMALVELVRAAPDELESAQAMAARVLARVARLSDARSGALRDVARSDRAPSSFSSPDDVSTNQLINESVDVSKRARSSRGVHRSSDEVHRLVEPLSALCERLKLPGITNTAGLANRLGPYSDAQVSFAVNKLVVEARSGACGRPIGKLANVAADGLVDYFPPDAQAGPESFTGSPPVVDAPVDPLPEMPEPADPETVKRLCAEARDRLKG